MIRRQKEYTEAENSSSETQTQARTQAQTQAQIHTSNGSSEGYPSWASSLAGLYGEQVETSLPTGELRSHIKDTINGLHALNGNSAKPSLDTMTDDDLVTLISVRLCINAFNISYHNTPTSAYVCLHLMSRDISLVILPSLFHFSAFPLSICFVFIGDDEHGRKDAKKERISRYHGQ